VLAVNNCFGILQKFRSWTELQKAMAKPSGSVAEWTDCLGYIRIGEILLEATNCKIGRTPLVCFGDNELLSALRFRNESEVVQLIRDGAEVNFADTNKSVITS